MNIILTLLGFAFLVLTAERTQGQSFFVISPNVFRLNVEETVSVQVSSQAAVELYLQDVPNRLLTISKKEQNVQPQKPVIFNLKITEKDLPKSWKGGKQYYYLVVKLKATNVKKETEILLDFRNGTVFIQTDKPIYTPKQDVRFRIIPVGLDLKPSKEKISVEIKNPQGIRVERMKDLYTYGKGFVTKLIRLGDYPVIGNWTITALFGNKDLVQSSVTFEVREYVLPKFSVSISPPPYVTEKEKRFAIRVEAKYTYGKPVKGTVRVRVYIQGTGKEILIEDQKGVIDGPEVFTVGVDKITSPKEIASFPLDRHLKIFVEVTERATGQKEQAVDTSTILVKSPYIITFERTVKNYKPGLPFQVKVNLVYPNKRPAMGIKLGLEATDGEKAVGLSEVAQEAETNKNGHGQFTLNMPSVAVGNKITIKITTNDPIIDNTAATYVVVPYLSNSKSYVLVRPPSQVPKVGEQVQFEAVIPKNFDGINQLNYLVVSRGVIVTNSVILGNLGTITSIPLRIKAEMAPTSRIVVYYIKGGEVVADSVLMDVEDTFANKVALVRGDDSKDFFPSKEFHLTVKTQKKSLVGILGVDQSIYLLRNNSKLTQKKVFTDIGSFDLGCGLGAGKDNRDVFETAGLAVITNVVFSTTKRTAISCPAEQGKRRKRRAVDDRLKSMFGKCCKLGCCENVHVGGRIPRNIKCVDLKDKVSSKCWKDFLTCCKGESNRGRKAGDDDIDADPIEEESDQLRLRQDFRETWIWEEKETGDKDSVTMKFTVPDTITTWVVSALSINNQTGLGLSKPMWLASTMKFFIGVKMPYSVQRNEQVSIYAVLYNYHSQPIRAILYLIGHDSFCSSAKAGKRSPKITLNVPGNDAIAIPFTIIPLKVGNIPIEFVSFNNFAGSDQIMRNLLVVPEGVEKIKTVSLLLDPRDTMKDEKSVKPTQSIRSTQDNKQDDIVELMIPGNFVKDSENVMVYVTGNLMGAAVTDIIDGGLEKLLRIPTGCGEQTMIKMAPVVYVLRYLDNIKEGVTNEVEQKAYTYTRQGYAKELTWRRSDSSYSAWGNRRTGSTWLTAFVNKVFCQAREFIKDDIDEKIVCESAQYLVNQQAGDATFVEKQAVIHKEMTGGVSGKTALTAFVLISLLECRTTCKNINSSPILLATAYLETQLQQINKPYVMAIVTYALALAESPRKTDANKKLRTMMTSEVRKGRDIRYWKENGAALTVEATAYALLAQLKLDEVDFSGPIVIWLTEERNARGSFHSTQDTCVALQALSEYSIQTAGGELDLTVEVTSALDPNIKEKFEITPDNALVRQQAKITGALGGKLFIETAGKGTAQLQIETTYNVPTTAGQQCGYELEVTTDEGIAPNVANDADVGGAIVKKKPDTIGKCIKNCKKQCKGLKSKGKGKKKKCKRKCQPKCSSQNQGVRVVDQINVQVCARHKHANASGMAMIEVGLLTGFRADTKSVQQLLSENPKINHYEISDRNVVFYLDTIPSTEKTCIRFLTRRIFDIGNVQAVPVKVYDYYEPDDSCTKFYGPKKGSELMKIICELDECECGQGGCAAFDHFLTPKTIKIKACSKTDFVFVGKVIEVVNENSWQRIAITTIDIIKRGKVDYKPGAKVLVYQMTSCLYPKFKKDKKYIVMLKDGVKYVINNEAFVMEYPGKGNKNKKKILDALKEVQIGIVCDDIQA